jgi:hypothetical protein
MCGVATAKAARILYNTTAHPTTKHIRDTFQLDAMYCSRIVLHGRQKERHEDVNDSQGSLLDL